jgi:sugar lactone lactonase YvrE
MGRDDARMRTLVLAIGAASALLGCGNVTRARNEAPATCQEPSPTPSESVVGSARVLVNDRYPNSIAVDAYGVYWSAENGNVRMLAHGTAEPRTLFQHPPDVPAVVLDDNAIYFSGLIANDSAYAVFRRERDQNEPRMLATVTERVWTLVLDAERVYFPGDTGHVSSVPKLGGEPRDTVIATHRLRGLAVDESHLYWIEGEPLASDVKRVAKTGGTPQVLASGYRYVEVVQVVGDDVLFTADHGLFAVPRTGGCTRALTSDQCPTLGGFVVNADQLYYICGLGEYPKSSIRRAPLAGGTTVEATRAAGGGLVFFADRLYWTNDVAVHVLEL